MNIVICTPQYKPYINVSPSHLSDAERGPDHAQLSSYCTSDRSSLVSSIHDLASIHDVNMYSTVLDLHFYTLYVLTTYLVAELEH